MDSDLDDKFCNTNSSTTMPILSLNTSTVCLSLPLETVNDIQLASSFYEKQLQMSNSNDTIILSIIIVLTTVSFTSKNSGTFVTEKKKINNCY